VALLESAIRVAGSNVTISATGKVEIRTNEYSVIATRVSMKSSGDMVLKGSKIIQD